MECMTTPIDLQESLCQSYLTDYSDFAFKDLLQMYLCVRRPQRQHQFNENRRRIIFPVCLFLSIIANRQFLPLFLLSFLDFAEFPIASNGREIVFSAHLPPKWKNYSERNHTTLILNSLHCKYRFRAHMSRCRVEADWRNGVRNVWVIWRRVLT